MDVSSNPCSTYVYPIPRGDVWLCIVQHNGVEDVHTYEDIQGCRDVAMLRSNFRVLRKWKMVSFALAPALIFICASVFVSMLMFVGGE